MPFRKPTFLATLVAVVAALSILTVPSVAAAEDFGVNQLVQPNFDELGQDETQAGAHPYGSGVRIRWRDYANQTELAKDILVELPPGLVGNPMAVPKCPMSIFGNFTGFSERRDCPADSQVGIIAVDPVVGPQTVGVFNLEPAKGTVAQFGFKLLGVPTLLTARLRPYDYGVNFTVNNLITSYPPSFSSTLFWGVPADPSHDILRSGRPEAECSGYPGDVTPFGSSLSGCGFGPTPAEAPRRPFVSLPQDCAAGPLTISATVRSWQNPATPRTGTTAGFPEGMTGCEQLPFEPRIEARATTPLADSPSGLDVRVTIPQEEDPDGLSSASMKKIVMDLPKGMTVNPSSANGLGACSPEQMGMTTAIGNPEAHFDGEAVRCPDNSRLGTVESVSPAVDHPLPGSIYLAEQGNNPFNSLLALYLVVDDPQTGVRVKLAGKAEADPSTGQLRTVFENAPQLPVEDLKVNLFTGPRASLKTPLACGTYTSTADMTPWTTPYGANVAKSDSFAISQGANGGACVSSESSAPNSPSFSAGTLDPAAGAYSPFVLKLTRQDGTQRLKRIDATLPKGLLGKLAGIPYCSDQALASAAGKSGKAEQSSSSCPSASQIGSVNVGAGAGSQPLYVDGKAYLAGPYKGAPLSLAIVTPAVAGPFDLGTVVVRTRLEVNPETAQIKAVSDEIPTILQGIPLDVRSISVRLDKPSFTLNPTSCNKTEIFASATSVFNQSAELKSPFQVGGCGALGFKPKLALDLKGATKRGKYPALKATLTARPGDANIAKAIVSLPHSAFLAQEHIKTICTRVQFSANACPAGSIYGKATAWSPLLDKPLSGPVYLRSSSNKLPDLVVDLNGQIRVNLVGRIDSNKGGIRNSFELVPDAPVSKFVLEMQGGKKGLLQNSRNLCKSVSKAEVKMDAQNGKAWDFRPVLTNDCGKKAKKKSGKKGKKRNGGKGKR
jgi:hypothetical protein